MRRIVGPFIRELRGTRIKYRIPRKTVISEMGWSRHSWVRLYEWETLRYVPTDRNLLLWQRALSRLVEKRAAT